jgi:hypothetical protein
MAHFKKGQRVYYFSNRCSEVYLPSEKRSILVTCIIERIVDACGVKQMTFEDHGNDDVFGRKAYAPFDRFFATPEEALSSQAAVIDYTRTDGYRYEYIHLTKIYSDQDKTWYHEVTATRLGKQLELVKEDPTRSFRRW